MLRLEVKTYALILALSGLLVLAGCASEPPLYRQIAKSEGLTLEEKIQQLVYRGASRAEVLATFGESTAYTNDSLSYTVFVNDMGEVRQAIKKISPYMSYDDPGRPWESFRWVLRFDEGGVLYD